MGVIQVSKHAYLQGSSNNLKCEVVVFLLLFGSQSIPPLSKYLADSAVVLVWVSLMNQCTMPLAEDHKCIHGPPDVVFLPL